MKKSLRITGILSLILLYSFATACCSALSLRADTFGFKGSDQEKYQQSVAQKSFQHTVQTENAATVCTQHHLPVAKDTYKNFCIANQATDHVLIHDFAQYHFFSNKLLVRLQNPDLVFPFQYFW